MSVNLSKYNNSWYKPGKNKMIILLWYFVSLIFFRSGLIPSSKLLSIILRLFSAKIGKKVIIKPFVNIKYPWNLTIGDNSWIGEKVWIDNLDKVNIGKNCCISQESYLMTGNHDYKSKTFDLIIDKIKIKDGAWVGAKSIICGGSTLNYNCVLTAGSVLSKNTEESYIYKGNPALKTKKRELK